MATAVLFIPAALMVLGAILAHFRVIAPIAGFGLTTVSAPVGVAIAVIWAVARLRGLAAPPAWWALSLSLGPAVFLAIVALPVFRYPRINDITTNVTDPPEFRAVATGPDARGLDLTFPEASIPAIQSAYPDVQSLTWAGDAAFADAVYEAAWSLAANHARWTLLRADPEARELEGIATSTLFRFQDYFVIRVSFRDNQVVVDMRSKSRDGQSDFGVNANRIHTFLAAVRAAVPGPA